MIERKIIIGLITSTEFLQRIKPFWDNTLIESAVAKRLAIWCWQYYDKYGEAPGKNIEAIFYTKIRSTNFPKDLIEEIENDILPGLSKEYERQDTNIDYLVEEGLKHLNSRYISIHTEQVEALRSSGQIVEAEKLASEFRPLGAGTVDLNKFILNVEQVRQHKRPLPTLLIKPWLRAGQTTIVYGTFGAGKSLLTILLGYMVGLKDYKEVQINRWQVKNPTGCLYIDGELGEQEMEERVKQFEWLGDQQGKYRMRILSLPEYQMATEDTFYLSERVNQLKIIHWLKEHPAYKLIVLDSASTLFGLIEENSNSEWNNKVNPFLRDLRAMGIACLLLHHAGKDSKKGLRGASAMGAMAHNIFRLTNHEQKDPDGGEAWFVLSKDKQRAKGFQFRTFSIHFHAEEDGTHWEIT